MCFPSIKISHNNNVTLHLRFEPLNLHIRNSAAVRRWFTQNVLLSPPTRLSEYILLAPSQEVRMVFVKLMTVCCLFAGSDEPIPGYDGDNLCEQILKAALSLLKNDVAEHGKHLGQYFTLFSLYAATGPTQKQQLLKVCVIELVCLTDTFADCNHFSVKCSGLIYASITWRRSKCLNQRILF